MLGFVFVAVQSLVSAVLGYQWYFLSIFPGTLVFISTVHMAQRWGKLQQSGVLVKIELLMLRKPCKYQVLCNVILFEEEFDILGNNPICFLTESSRRLTYHSHVCLSQG